MTAGEFNRATVVAARRRAMRLGRSVRPYDYDRCAEILADGFAAVGIEVDAPGQRGPSDAAASSRNQPRPAATRKERP